MLGQNVLNDIVRKANRTQLLIDFLVLARTLYLLRAKGGRRHGGGEGVEADDVEQRDLRHRLRGGNCPPGWPRRQKKADTVSVSQLVYSSWFLKVVALGGLESGGAEERVSEGRKVKGSLQNFPRGTGSHPALWDEGEVESGLKSLCYVAYRR